jgi:polyphenol oxidase
MPFNQLDSLRYYTFDLLNQKEIVHGVFTREGGVSPVPWNSLNVGGLVGDTRENIIENRARIFKTMGREVETIFDVWQVHSRDVVCAEQPRPLDAPHQKADAIITNQPGITLFMRFADCVPVLLYDPCRKVVGLVHAGWQGTIKKIAAEAITAMTKQYQCQPEDILAGIGPSIGPDHYAVGGDVIAQVQNAFGKDAGALLLSREEKVYLDLWKANEIVLQQAGVHSIQVAGQCTACHPEVWFSHRQENGSTGRFGAVIALNGSTN